MRSPHARPVTLGLAATGIFVISSGMSGTALAAASPSATATPSSTGASSAPASSSAPAVSGTPAPYSSAVSHAAASPTTAAGSSAPAAKAANSAAASPSASPSPAAPSTAASATPTPTSTPTATPTPTKPAVAVTASGTSVQAGGSVLFRISAWSSSAENGTIATTLTPSAKSPAFSQPVFTVDSCASNPTKTSCDLTLPAAQPSAPQIEASVSVPKTAPAGETIKFTATVSVPDGSGSPLTATVNGPTVTVAKSASPTPTSSSTKQSTGAGTSPSPGTGASGSSATIAGVSGSTYSLPLGTIPLVGSSVPGTTTTIPAGSASSLFPQISPSTVPNPAPGSQAGKGDPVADSSKIPLSLGSSEFGAQIVGLIILLLGVAIAVTRISVRKVRPTGKSGG